MPFEKEEVAFCQNNQFTLGNVYVLGSWANHLIVCQVSTSENVTKHKHIVTLI